MASYQAKHMSATFGTSVSMIAALLASGHMPAEDRETHDVAGGRFMQLLDGPYYARSINPSFNKYRVLLGGSIDLGERDFVEGISEFYATLLSQQEPLGEQFSRILHENLWSLYER